MACSGFAQTQKFVSHFPIDAPAVPAEVRAETRGTPWQNAERGPVDGLKVFAREKSGAVWLGSDEGAARFDPHTRFRWDRWQYFYGRRWLPGDKVLNIWVDESDQSRRVWVRTEKGVSLIEWRPMKLEEKAKYFDERIEQRHVRHGLVAGSHLRVAGDLSSNERFSNDNDGLWTAIYLGAQAFRYAVTHEPDARAKARRALQALVRLEEITGVPGLPARSFVSAEEPLPKSGEWHPTPEGKWLWKGDTSSDELVGHYFAYAAYFDLVADDGEKEAIRKVVSRKRVSPLAETRFDRWFGVRETEHLVLARPFSGQIGEARDANAVWQATVDRRLHEIGCEEGQRDRHVDLPHAAPLIAAPPALNSPLPFVVMIEWITSLTRPPPDQQRMRAQRNVASSADRPQ